MSEPTLQERLRKIGTLFQDAGMSADYGIFFEAADALDAGSAETNTKLRNELHSLQDYLERIRRPEPMRLLGVTGIAKDGMYHELQIVRSFNDMEGLRVQVNLPT